MIVIQRRDGLSKLLQFAVEDVLGPSSTTMVDSSFDQINEQLVKRSHDFVLFVLGDGTSSTYHPAARVKWQATPIVAQVYRLVQNFPEIPVHVAIDRDRFIDTLSPNACTPLDVLALLSGVAGVWEISPTLLDDNEQNRLNFNIIRSAWAARAKFLYGEPARRLFQFQNLVTGDDWPKEGHGRFTPPERAYAKYCFRVASALACLSVSDMTPGNGPSLNMETYAQRFKMFDAQTGCAMGIDVVTRALRLLDRGWNERISAYDKKSRAYMPEWARSEGFPSSQPVVAVDLPDGYHVSEYLFDILNGLTFGRNTTDGRDWDPDRAGNPVYTIASLPRRSK